MTDKRPSPHPLALAMEWVAKITTVSLEMVLPAIGGGYLDQRFGTSHWALVGLVVGMMLGMWHLLQMTRQSDRNREKAGGKGRSGGSGDV